MNPSVAGASVAMGLAVWLLQPAATQARQVHQLAVRRHGWAGVAAVPAVILLGWQLGGASMALWTATALPLVGTGGVVFLHSRRARLRAAVEQQVAEATQMVASQLRLGAVTSVALLMTARDNPCMERAAASQRIGGDVPRVLREEGGRPGQEGLLALARAWQVGERTGAPIAQLASQVGERVRADQETRAEVDAELSGPRATARILAALPLVGIAMGRLAGGDPVGFLTGTLPGQGCLFGGVLLACAGVLWTERMAHSVQGV